MRLELRPYDSQADYWRIRPFLREVFGLNGQQEPGWPVYRFHRYRWLAVEHSKDPLRLRETPQAK